jgi:hypothetical protein
MVILWAKTRWPSFTSPGCPVLFNFCTKACFYEGESFLEALICSGSREGKISWGMRIEFQCKACEPISSPQDGKTDGFESVVK